MAQAPLEMAGQTFSQSFLGKTGGQSIQKGLWVVSKVLAFCLYPKRYLLQST